jgi:hypothetical protein
VNDDLYIAINLVIWFGIAVGVVALIWKFTP